MTQLIPPVIIGAVTAAADASGQLLEHGHVGIGTALTMGGCALSCALWLQGKFSDRDKELNALKLEVSTRLTAIEQAMKDLPCGHDQCVHREAIKKER